MSLPTESPGGSQKGDLPQFSVEQVMQQIRDQIRQRQVAFAESDGKLARDVSSLRAYSDIYYAGLPSRRPLIAPLLKLVKKIARWALTPSLARQVSYNMANTRAVERLMEHCETLARHYKRTSEELLHTQEEAMRAVRDQANILDRQQTEILPAQQQVLQEVQREVHNVRQQQLEASTDLAAVHEHLRAIEQAQARIHAATRERVSRAERTVRRVLHALTDGSQDDVPHPAQTSVPAGRLEPEFDYFEFEERMRGSEEEIKQRQAVYVDYFRSLGNVLDLGCGRGEFLELMREAGIRARGLDIDLDMKLCCQDKGLDVIREDAFTHLESLPDESLGGIFCAQLIEHLEPRRIVQLVRLCYRKLQPGAHLIMETVNPSCLITFAESFYADLSHIRPIHPQALKFLFEMGPFQEVELKFSAPVDPALRIPELPQGGEQFNRAIQRLNDLLYGFQDYAAIGRKGFAQSPSV